MRCRYAVLASFLPVATCALWAACTTPAPGTPLVQTFDRYEAIRVLLTDDTIDGVRQQATALAPLAGQVAGEEAQTAVSQLASAETLSDARLQFVTVSSALVPKFLEAKLPGVHGFMCPVRDGGTVAWAQRSANVQNPYFGKAMLNCGTELKASE